MTDSLDIRLFAVKQHAPSKGFDVAVFPNAPAGPEVVLSLREREEAEVPVSATVVTDPDVLKGRPPFMEVVVGVVTVLVDLGTAEEIWDVLMHYQIAQAKEKRDAGES